MIKYHFKVARRVFGRNAFSFFINIFSIAVGMTAFILVFLWVKYELSFDDFNQRRENIYRVTCEGKIFENNVKDATSGSILSKALPGTFPKVEDAAALLDFDFLFSLPSISFYRNATNDWMNANVFTYLLLDEKTDYKAFETKLNDFLPEQIGPILKQWRNLSIAEWKANGESWRFVLQPLSKIHLYSFLKNEAGQNGNITYIYMASIIGLFILIISIINFANLTTVHSISRGKGIMVKKVLGAARKSIARQFLAESILNSYIALIVSVFFIPLIIPVLENTIGIKIFSEAVVTPSMYIWLFLFPVIIGVIAGLYPAFVISAMAPLKVMAEAKPLPL